MTAIGLDHIGIAGADLDQLANGFLALGFTLTPTATHESGRTANRCAMFRDGGYLELMAVVPGQASATLDRFLAVGAGAHSLALEVADEAAALRRLRRARIEATSLTTGRAAAPDGAVARFGLIMTPDPPVGRALLIRHHDKNLLWRADRTTHPNGAMALTEAVFAAEAPARTLTWLATLTGQPAGPDPLGGYRIQLPRGSIRILPPAAAHALFPGASGAAPILGLTIATREGDGRVIHAGGVAMRLAAAD